MNSIVTKSQQNIFREGKAWDEHRNLFVEYLEKGNGKIVLKDRMEVTIQLAFCEAILGNILQAEKVLKNCEEYILSHGKEEEKALVYHVHSRIFLHKSKYEEGLATGIQSLHIFKQLHLSFFTMNTSIVCGTLCAYISLFAEAMDYLGQAYSIAMRDGNIRGALICKANLNDIRLNVLPVEDCILHNEELLKELKEEFGDEPNTGEAGTYIQLSHLYLKMKDLNAAEKYADKTLATIQQLKHLPPHHFLYTNTYATKADIAGSRGDEKAMLEYAEECSSRARQVQKKSPEIDVNFILFRFYLRNNTDKAGALLDKATALIKEDHKSSAYVELLENKCKYYQAKNDTVNELATFKLIYEYKMKIQHEVLNHRVKYMSTVHELEVKKKELEQHKTELGFKTQELNMTSYHLEQRNQLLTDLKHSVNEFEKTKPKAEVVFKSITKTIDRAFDREEDEKKRFREKFDEAHRTFIARLHGKFPLLSPTECRVGALLRSGFNTKEISNLLSTSVRNVENHRVSIRKKMELARDENLNLVLTAIE